MSRWTLAWLLGLTTTALVGLSMAYSTPPPEDNDKFKRMRLLVDVLDEVEKNFVRKLSDEELRQLVEDMINGGLARLDPYSGFINKENRREFDQHSTGKFGGIGIQIHADRQSGILTVISPIVGTPAYKAGVQAGDLILKIDGESTETMTRDKAVEKIRGDPDQPITLTVLHEGGDKPVDLKMKRAIIAVESILGDRRKANDQWDFMYDKGNKIAYLRLVNFDEKSPFELRDVLLGLKKEGVRGLVLDLRNNPGGLLTSAVYISTLFLKEGSKVVSIRGRNHRDKVHVADKYDVPMKDKVERIEPLLPSARDCPMTILINNGSASASEIVAAALQDHGRAVIVGQRSFGKGSVQNVINLENKTSILKLTTATYWRPSGRNIHRLGKKADDEWGVTPNGKPALLASLVTCQQAGLPGAPAFPGLFLLASKKKLSPFEVWLTDRERIQYRIDRYQKDKVPSRHEKKEPAQPKADGKKSKEEPFKDRVLETALTYLRQEIKKTDRH